MNYIVFDLEWNQSGYNPNHRMPHEIIEIGACRVDREGHVVSRFSELIRPRVYKRLDKHIKQVTGITEQELAQGRQLHAEAHVHDLGVAGVYVPADGGTDFCHGHWPHDNLVLQ